MSREGGADMTETSTADTTVTDTRGVPLCELRDIKVAFGGLHACLLYTSRCV